MNTNTSNSMLSPNRCQYRTPTGRRCCSSVSEPRSAFCARHALTAPNDSMDFSAQLIQEGDHFQEAQQINQSLIALYKLVAAGRISPRRASVLAYVANLILNSLKAIDYDNRWHRKRLSAIHPTRPDELPAAVSIGPGTEPLPETPQEFIEEVLSHKSN